MKIRVAAIGLCLMLPALLCAKDIGSQTGKRSISQIKQAIIEESIESYPGRCPCPYNATRNGRACGGRSAYSRPGGYSPVCYMSDVTAEMVRTWQAGRQLSSSR